MNSSVFNSNKAMLKFLLLVLVSIFIISGCGNSEATTEPDALEPIDEVEVTEAEEVVEEDEIEVNNAYPITVTDHAGREVVFETIPTRITTVIPGDMEIIYTLGGEVAGRPQSSSGIVRPVEATDLQEVGHPHEVNFELLVDLEADLFIGHSRVNMKDVETLESLGINVLLTKGDSVEDIIHIIELYGKILDRTSEAEALISNVESTVTEIQANKTEQPLRTLILFGTPDETMAALPQSLPGSIFSIAGAENIASDFERLERYPTYAQLSLERVLEANPDVIYFMSHGNSEEAVNRFKSEMESNPAWNNMDAVKNDRLIMLPHELFGTNPGTRIVDSLEFLKESLASIELN